MNPETNHPVARAPVRDGLDAYAKALAFAGGKELDAITRAEDRGAVCAAIYASPPYDLRVPALPVSRLSVNLTRSRVSGGIEGERARSYQAMPYSMFLVPAGVAVAWRKELPSRHLTLYFHADVLHDAEEDGVVFDHGQPLFNARLKSTRQLANELAAELDGPGMLRTLATDSLARLLLIRLARRLRGSGATSNPVTPEVLSSLREYVVAHLPDRILVADLAREAGLSPNRFAQAFTERTRQSPHRFVLALRLDAATRLLRTSNLNLVEVASDCGFADQQHLSNAMRRHLGTTPSQYRRTHRTSDRNPD